MTRRLLLLLAIAFGCSWQSRARGAEPWPRWRGPSGNAVADASRLPVHWSPAENVLWKRAIPGEGSSSPILWQDRLWITSAAEFGTRRLIHCLDRRTGKTIWSAEVNDDDPELTSALTGYAAPTPATDGQHVVAFFGNGGLVCWDADGRQLWRRRLGPFESELGLASSPIIVGDGVIQVCDHDGTRFTTFDSYLICLDLQSGQTRWKTPRPGLKRSWSTPIVVPAPGGKQELVVNAQDELRGYDLNGGQLLWRVGGMTGWVTPSPVFGQGLIFATSGKDGPTVAVRPGGRGDVTDSHVAWRRRRGAPYVCSPVLYDGHLYVHNEQGVLTCFEAATGKVVYQKRLQGKFFASSVAGDGKLYLANDAGDVYVVQTGTEYRLLARNAMDEEILASPAISDGRLYLRTRHHLYAIGVSQP